MRVRSFKQGEAIHSGPTVTVKTSDIAVGFGGNGKLSGVVTPTVVSSPGS